MSVTTADLTVFLARIAVIATEREQELNKADGKLGDGDTGMTLRRVFARIAELPAPPPADLGAFFKAAGMAASGATGSSLGSLIAFSCLNLAKAYAGRSSLDTADIPDLLGHACETMLARGGAARGDKTVIDTLSALQQALQGLELGDMAPKAAQAADETLTQFRDRPNRVGRARMFSDRSVGMDDPGMLAATLICRDLAAEQQPAAARL